MADRVNWQVLVFGLQLIGVAKSGAVVVCHLRASKIYIKIEIDNRLVVIDRLIDSVCDVKDAMENILVSHLEEPRIGVDSIVEDEVALVALKILASLLLRHDREDGLRHLYSTLRWLFFTLSCLVVSIFLLFF